jgi:transposase-like protein
VHRNAPMTPEGRLWLCLRIDSGWTISATAEAMHVSRQTASKWWNRYLAEGEAGLADRSSRPTRCPHRTRRKVEQRILGLRRRRSSGPPASPRSSTCRPRRCTGCSCATGSTAWSGWTGVSGRVIRRIETSRPGELVHIDVKKQAIIQPGGGHKVLGREAGRRAVVSSICVTAGSVPTGPRPTARSNASIGRCSTSGPTCGSIVQKPSVFGDLNARFLLALMPYSALPS